MKKLPKKVRDILEANGWTWSVVDRDKKQYCVELYKYSPLGEDFGFSVWYDGTAYDFYWQAKEYYEDFDPEEHAAMWYEQHQKDVGRCPHGLRALLDDADAIEKMLEELYTALRRECEGG